MTALYTCVIILFGWVIRIASLFDPKARLWIRGRKDQCNRLPEEMRAQGFTETDTVIWFHCASLGEFEQGRPLIEKFRELYPSYRILLTFFSPSGFEVRKNYPGADLVAYLPLDTPRNARKFASIVNPSMVFIIKYEYWFNFLKEFRERNTPVFIISAIFRPQQHFFRWYGGWARRQLRHITWFFLQDSDSKSLVESIGIRNYTVAGDTRFDRVAAISSKRTPVPEAEWFADGKPVLIGGSTWPEDEALILPLIVNKRLRLKFIIAPHEVHEGRIGSLIAQIRALKGFPKGEQAVVRLSQVKGKQAAKAKVLVVDSIGHLSQLYQYSKIAFIGGGFGAGIHNILEAAAFGNPVVFGPNYQRFSEARELIRLGGAACMGTPDALKEYVKVLLSDTIHYGHVSDTCRIYVESGQGVTSRILESIRSYGFMPRPRTAD
jgi:3-deoxy-D-manno-octulosonic-acid transferase